MFGERGNKVSDVKIVVQVEVEDFILNQAFLQEITMENYTNDIAGKFKENREGPFLKNFLYREQKY